MSTVTTAKRSNQKATTVEKGSATIQLIQEVNRELLTPSYFPGLVRITNIQYVTMAIWALESSMRLLHGGGSSRHSSSSQYQPFGISYLKSTNVRSMLERSDITPQQRENIKDGYYAHGLTGAMGSYFIKGTVHNKEMSNHRAFMNKMAAEGCPLEIELGESMTSLFSKGQKDKNAIRTSLAQGLVILNDKVIRYAREYPSDHHKALLMAVGAYVGWGKDSNGYSGYDRVLSIRNSDDPRLKVLKDNGIYPEDKVLLTTLGEAVYNARYAEVAHNKKTGETSSATSIKIVSNDEASSPVPSDCV